MASQDDELKKVLADLDYLSVKRQEILEKRKWLCFYQELKNRVVSGQTVAEETASAQQIEIDDIDMSLKRLSDREEQLQRCYDSIASGCNNDGRIKHILFNTCHTTVPPEPEPEPEPVSGVDIFYIGDPPTTPAPKVILDMDNLPPCPCKTRCPECGQYITTVTRTSISSFTWQACFITALIGCVAGCCLIPFCFDTFKSITHKCPKCRTSIGTIKKL
ncbi:hypothetical protein JOB18_040932 [Solea senegalensis]|nr:hypothetical protein JOB18_040932 [Solea senegalensis]KAG7455686.1 hypothetical protein JOB18_040932 [Solea senegalensis]